MANFSHVIHTLTLRHCIQVAFLLMMLFVFMRLHSLPPYLHFNTQQGPYATWLYLMTPIDTIHYSLLPTSLSLQNHTMFSAYSCYTFALQARTHLTLPWPIVHNAIEKCRVCKCFRGENRTSIISFVYPERPQLILDHCIDMQLASLWHSACSAALQKRCLWNESMWWLS